MLLVPPPSDVLPLGAFGCVGMIDSKRLNDMLMILTCNFSFPIMKLYEECVVKEEEEKSNLQPLFIGSEENSKKAKSAEAIRGPTSKFGNRNLPSNFRSSIDQVSSRAASQSHFDICLGMKQLGSPSTRFIEVRVSS